MKNVIWLKKLRLVKAEFESMQWPSPGESLNQGLMLMARGLNIARAGGLTASKIAELDKKSGIKFRKRS